MKGSWRNYTESYEKQTPKAVIMHEQQSTESYNHNSTVLGKNLVLLNCQY